MPFCSHCGSELTPGARFCAACGAPAEEPAAVVPVVSAPPSVSQIPAVNAGDLDYGVVLYSIGTCAKSYADDVLEDILGYSDSEAKTILKTLPTQIAQFLSAEQAQYIAQALTEYGMQVAIYKGRNPVDLGQYATKSVFNSDGSLIAAALAALSAISVSNRIRRIRRWSLSNILSSLFRPKYHVTPPRHVTRIPARREPAPAPRPEPRRTVISQREPKRRFGASGTPARPGTQRPGGSHGGQGGAGGHGGPGGPRGGR